MDDSFKNKNNPAYYETPDILLLQGNSLEIMAEMPPESVDVIFADPPYFLSNGGITCSGGKMVSVNKGMWDQETELVKKDEFNQAWIAACYRILKPNGTIWVSGTLHNIFSVGYAMEKVGFVIINNITWQKLNPPPNLACKCFTHSTENIIWAKKQGGKPCFNYELMKELNGGKQMKDVWTGPLTPPSEKKEGKHPTQKPLYLLERIILSSSREGAVILDPFTGSSTTGVAAKRLGRRFIGIDLSSEYLDLSVRRIEAQML